MITCPHCGKQSRMTLTAIGEPKPNKIEISALIGAVEDLQAFIPPCEVCKEPSKIIVYDRSMDGGTEEIHHFCLKHQRNATTIGSSVGQSS